MDESIYEKMTDKIGLHGSKLITELFKMIASHEEAELLMQMPGTPEQLAESIGGKVEYIEKICTQVYHKGLAFKTYKGDKVGYKMCRDLVQFHDATILWPEAPVEYLDKWQRFMEEEWPQFARILDKVLVKPFTRIIPVQKAVEAGNQQILDFESAMYMIENAGAIAVTKCTCRLIAHRCERPLEVCLQIDNAARYTIDRGSGREIDKNEAMEILSLAEKEGLVHITMNKAAAGHFICNCCGCCCQTLPLTISEGLKLTDPSRYRAKIDIQLCSGCGLCLDRCYFNAIEEITGKDGNSIMKVLDDKCLGCGLCTVTCPEDAIILEEFRPVDFIPS